MIKLGLHKSQDTINRETVKDFLSSVLDCAEWSDTSVGMGNKIHCGSDTIYACKSEIMIVRRGAHRDSAKKILVSICYEAIWNIRIVRTSDTNIALSIFPVDGPEILLHDCYAPIKKEIHEMIIRDDHNEFEW